MKEENKNRNLPEDDFMDEDYEDALDQIPLPEEQKASNHTGQNYGLGLTAMILGILSLLSFCLPVLGLVLAAVAIVLGIVATARGKGKKMGTSGIIMGSISLLTYLIILLLFGGIFNITSKNRDYFSDTAWRRTSDGSVLYLYEDGTFIDVEQEGVFSDNFYTGTYDVVPYKDTGLVFTDLEKKHRNDMMYDVILHVNLYVANGKEQEGISDNIRYLYMFDRPYNSGDAVSVCVHDSRQYGAVEAVRETTLAYPYLGNEYVTTEQLPDLTEDMSETDSTDLTVDETETSEGASSENTTASEEGSEAVSESTTEGGADTAAGTTQGLPDFWSESGEKIDESYSSVSEEWERRSEEVSSAAEEVSSAAEEVSSAFEEASSAFEEASSAAEEIKENVDVNGIQRFFERLIQRIEKWLEKWSF